MKKNFIKKTLASTLAFAMVASVVPVAPAAAAKAPALNKTGKIIYLNEDNEIGNTFNFNVVNQVKGSTYKWTTADKTIATINSSNGIVTAQKEGTVKITCKITLPTKKTKTLTATVKVKENAVKAAISNPTEAMKINEEHNFNKSFTTASGGKCTDYQNWVLDTTEGSNTAGATVDAKSGKVTATKAGSFKVKVQAYQNATKLAAGDVSAESEWLTVKVAPSIVGVAQTHSAKVGVTFDDNMKDKLKTSDFAIKNKVTNQVMTIKGLSYSDDGKVVSVETFVSYSDAANYVLTYGGKDFDFSTSIGEPATIEITTPTAVVNEETTIKVAVKNANGVDITDLKGSKVTITEVQNTTDGYLYNGKITLYKKDAVAKLRATYHSGEWNSDGTEKNVVTTDFQIVCVDKATVTYGSILYTITGDSNKVDMTKVATPVTSLSVSDGTKYLHVNIKGSNDKTITEKDGLTFESSNVNVLIVDPTSGALTGVKDGVAYVLVKKDNVTLGTVQVNVLTDRKAATISLDNFSLTLSNKAAGLTKSVKVTVKDQHGADITGDCFEIAGVDDKSKALITAGKVTINAGNIVVSPYDVAKDTYKFFVKAKNTVNGNAIQNVLTVNVETTTNTTVSSYRVDLSDRTMDAIVTKDSEASKNITVNLVGYNTSGVQVSYGSSVSYKVLNKDGKDVTATFVEATATSLIFHVTKKDVTGVVTKAPAGTYRVEAVVNIAGTDTTIGNSFTITDTQALPYVVQTKQVVDTVMIKGVDGKATNATDIFKAAFDTKDANGIKLGDADSKVTNVEVVDSIATGTTLFVKKVKVTQKITDTLFIANEIDVNLSVVAK